MGFTGLTPYAPSKPLPAEWDMRATYLSVIAMPYNPCDQDGDPVFMGVPKGCFHHHQSMIHYKNGQSAPYYPVLDDGTLDFFGVCNVTQAAPYRFFDLYQGLYAAASPWSPAYDPKVANDFGHFLAAEVASGSLLIPHDRTWGLHFCIDYSVDPDTLGGLNQPYACTLPATVPQWPSGANMAWLGNQMILDALSFIPDSGNQELSDAMHPTVNGDFAPDAPETIGNYLIHP